MARLENKVAIVTGGARGQGAAEAELFAAEGAKVIIADVIDGAGIAGRIGGAAIFARLDVTEPNGWRDLVELAVGRFGRIDILVNNAGVFRRGNIGETDAELMELHFRVNQLGTMFGMQAVAPAMAATGGGSIINISSISGLRASPDSFAYSASKWAIRGMSRSAALTYARDGIRVNTIFPGLIDTPMLEHQSVPLMEAFTARIPLKRRGTPEEVAAAALFFASDEASYVTGAELNVCGGSLA